tara:strand:- start:103 stop:360 length:258 start_codon:yes stop_codon:yes gene_type:complete
MSWTKLFIFFISSFSGYFIGGWIAQAIKHIAPEYFNIDPNIFKVWLSRKPSMSSQMLGYIIYAVTSAVMFTMAVVLEKFFNNDEE